MGLSLLHALYMCQLLLAGCYIVIGVITVRQSLYIWRLRRVEGAKDKHRRQQLFHVFILLNVIGRCVFFFRPPSSTNLKNFPALILMSLPATFFFTTYSLLLKFWADVYYKAHQRSSLSLSTSPLIGTQPLSTTTDSDSYTRRSGQSRFTDTHLLIVNIITYSVQFIIYFLPLRYSMSTVFLIDGVYFALVSILSAVGFLVFGVRLYLTLKGIPVKSPEKLSKMQKVGRVTTVCTLCFLFRAVTVLLTNYPLLEDAYESSWADWLIMFSFYGIVEIIPSLLVLNLLESMQRKIKTGTINPGSGRSHKSDTSQSSYGTDEAGLYR